MPWSGSEDEPLTANEDLGSETAVERSDNMPGPSESDRPGGAMYDSFDDDPSGDYSAGYVSDSSLDDDNMLDPDLSDLPDQELSDEDSGPAGHPAPSGSTTPMGFDPLPLYNGNPHPPSYYQQREADCDEGRFHKKKYAVKFSRELDRVRDVWISFCRHTRRTWRATMKNIDLRVVDSFLHFHLSQKTGDDGKRKRGTKITRSLRTFWDNFRRVYERELRLDIDWKLNRNAVNNLIVACNDEFGLSSARRDNRPMLLDDLRLQVEAILGTREKGFKLGEQRILAALFLLMLAPMGSRPEAILQMRYGDIEIALHQPKAGGPPKLLIYTTHAFTKTYLGTKDTKTFIIPEVLYDPSMFLSPHIFLLAILFRHRAFRVEKLNDDPSMLAQLKVPPGPLQLEVPLKEELANEYIFCAVDRGPTGYFSSSKRIPYGTMNAALKSIGRIVGFETNATSYHLRYAAGNRFNQCPNISKDMQNLMMDHAPNSDTFQRNYLPRSVTFDVFALLRDLEPQTEIVREAGSFGYRRNADRPTGLTEQQAKALKDHPEYKYYESRLKSMRRGTAEWHQAKKDARATLERLRYAATTKAIGKEWSRDFAVQEIEQQIGVSVGTTSTTTTAGAGGAVVRRQQEERLTCPRQQEMVDALHQPMQTTVEKQLQLRTSAVLAILRYCDVQDPIRSKLQQKHTAPTPQIMLQLPPTLRVAEETRLRNAVTVQYDGQRLKTCYICVGIALTRAPSDPELPELCRDYYTPANCARHFRRTHLKFMKKGHLPPCPICIPRVKFKSLMYLQSHAQDVHGIYQSGVGSG